MKTTKAALWRGIPFLIICIIHLYTWVQLFATDNAISYKHLIALLLLLVNAFLYYKQRHYGLILTPVILLLSALSIIELYLRTSVSAAWVNIAGLELDSPTLQWRSVGLLLVYCICNGGYWIEVYSGYKYKRGSKF